MLDGMDAKQRKLAEYRRAYYEANRDKVAEYKRAYYESRMEANRLPAAEIKAARVRRGYTQKELARLLGVARSTLACWETGRVNADWDKLCAVLPELEIRRK